MSQSTEKNDESQEPGPLETFTVTELIQEFQRRYEVGVIVLEQNLGKGETGEVFQWFGPLSWAYGLAQGAADDLKAHRQSIPDLNDEEQEFEEDDHE